MATIKSYTDLSQSKVLSETLSLESADFCYIKTGATGDNWMGIPEYQFKAIPYKDYRGESIGCWSLAALLDVLPNNENISTNLSKGGYRISPPEYTNSWFVDYEDETDGLNNCVTSADNPVDACYEMILKLHKLKLL